VLGQQRVQLLLSIGGVVQLLRWRIAPAREFRRLGISQRSKVPGRTPFPCAHTWTR
jgi:hypothetical protein